MLKNSKKGFSLIELLIVLAILFGFLLVVFPKMKTSKEVSNIKKDSSTAISISNEAIILQKQGVEISSSSWNKASDIRVISRDGSEKTLAECASVNVKAQAKEVKGCDFYVKLDEEGKVLVSIKEGSRKNADGEPIETYVQVYPEVYADEPYRSNY